MPAVGEQVFKTNCSICHSVQPQQNIIGPSLFGVVGRHSGQVPGFHYTEANRSSGLTWDAATLDHYLTSPRQVVPGTLTTFPGLKDPRQRSDVIAFLARFDRARQFEPEKQPAEPGAGQSVVFLPADLRADLGMLDGVLIPGLQRRLTMISFLTGSFFFRAGSNLAKAPLGARG